MNPPENHAHLSAASDLSRRDFTRLAATALVGSLPVGLIGCASLPSKSKTAELHEAPGKWTGKMHGHRHGHDHGGPHTLSCAKFIDPVHDQNVSIAPGATSTVKITVRWQNNGCNLASGIVSVFCVNPTTLRYYCGKQSFTASTTQPIVFTVTGGTSVGPHKIFCYITGKAADGSDMDPMSHGHGTTGHCTL